MALVTSVIGTLTASKVGPGVSSELHDTAAQYADAVEDGDMGRADGLLSGLPQDSVDAIKNAVAGATSSAITTSMLVLAAVALGGATFAWVVIGRRRTPDHIQVAEAVV